MSEMEGGKDKRGDRRGVEEMGWTDMVVGVDGGSRRKGDVRDDQRERTVGRADGGNELSPKTILDV